MASPSKSSAGSSPLTQRFKAKRRISSEEEEEDDVQILLSEDENAGDNQHAKASPVKVCEPVDEVGSKNESAIVLSGTSNAVTPERVDAMITSTVPEFFKMKHLSLKETLDGLDGIRNHRKIVDEKIKFARKEYKGGVAKKKELDIKERALEKKSAQKSNEENLAKKVKKSLGYPCMKMVGALSVKLGKWANSDDRHEAARRDEFIKMAEKIVTCKREQPEEDALFASSSDDESSSSSEESSSDDNDGSLPGNYIISSPSVSLGSEDSNDESEGDDIEDSDYVEEEEDKEDSDEDDDDDDEDDEEGNKAIQVEKKGQKKNKMDDKAGKKGGLSEEEEIIDIDMSPPPPPPRPLDENFREQTLSEKDSSASTKKSPTENEKISPRPKRAKLDDLKKTSLVGKKKLVDDTKKKSASDE